MADKKIRKKKSSKLGRTVKVLAIALVVLVVAGVVIYDTSVSAPSSDEAIVPFTVSEGDTYSSLGEKLKEQGFIRSETAYKIMIRTSNPDTLYAGTYPLSKSMPLKEIVAKIASGQTYLPDAFFLTFPEGRNMRHYAALIAENTVHTEEDVFALMKDEAYLDSLIDKYWFITDEIKDPEIYYALEGYLFPDTYQFTGPDMPLEDIFEMMIDQTAKVIDPYRESISSRGYTVHEMITLASIIELEAGNAQDRAGVAGVFYNRLEDGWSLGSDVTTYYAIQVDMGDRDLFMSELNDENAYNTRHPSMAGKLPVSPICNPGRQSLEASLNPDQGEFFYFVADRNGVTYFSRTEAEHEGYIRKLSDEGLLLWQ